MRIDPVLTLMDELEAAYVSLSRARNGGDWETTRAQLATIASLHANLRETEPTSVVGAAHLLREAASLLPRSVTPHYGDGLREVATRFDSGERRIFDLVWLREILAALESGVCGRPGRNIVPLIARAVKGAARPILFYRAVQAPPPQCHAPARSETRV